MFELFKRVKTVVASELHALIDKAEDPVHMIDQFIREMNQEIVDAEKATAKMMGEEKLLARKVEETKKLIEKRELQAIEALKNNREDLAKRALEDKSHLTKEHQQLEDLHTQALHQVVDLKEKLKVMKNEFREMELKRNSLKARAEAAKAKTSINRALSTTNTSSAKKGFERMEEKVLRQEAEAETSEDLQMMNKSLDQEINEITGKSEVELELERLKERLQEDKKLS
ncbi:phage shock protein A (PspA) family protein [Bacillus oleivorans]|uniref:Phage shock protein A (PspA) family protein n=1 Tax=Bacillus oleivorans TaxID=1448271 RepID=A0A285CV65_9BACI|nr:PspA/IM30 family protein [Bacillus oleivorans]SNX70916.1 phage shock protein A (PspA) family protein [Bacillus oleivorans]